MTTALAREKRAAAFVPVAADAPEAAHDFGALLAQIEQRLRAMADVPFSPLVEPLLAALTAPSDHMRARVALAAGHAYGVASSKSFALATALETLHVATLVHESISNASRGNEFVGAVVLMGDHLFAHAAVLAAQADSPAIVNLFGRAIQDISQAQVRHALANQAADFSANSVLCATAAVGIGVLSGAPLAEQDALRVVGACIGRWADTHRLNDLRAAQLAIHRLENPDARRSLLALLR